MEPFENRFCLRASGQTCAACPDKSVLKPAVFGPSPSCPDRGVDRRGPSASSKAGTFQYSMVYYKMVWYSIVWYIIMLEHWPRTIDAGVPSFQVLAVGDGHISTFWLLLCI